MASNYHSAQKEYLDPALRNALLARKLSTMSQGNVDAMLFNENGKYDQRREDYLKTLSDANKMEAATQAAKMQMALQAKILSTAPTLSQAGIPLSPAMQALGGIDQTQAADMGQKGLLAEMLGKQGSGLRDAASAGVRVGSDFTLDPATGEARGLLTQGTPISVEQAKALGSEQTTRSIPGLNGQPDLVIGKTVKNKGIAPPPTPDQIQQQLQAQQATGQPSSIREGIGPDGKPVWIVKLPNGKITSVAQ